MRRRSFYPDLYQERICKEANQTMADQLKEETEKLLDSVLYTRSMEMKNGFHMSDF